MEIPSPLQLLTVWEQGVNQSSPEQALLLLSATLPDALPDALARQSIGRRNRLLLAARERLFGSVFLAAARCPACGEGLELTFTTAELAGVAEPATVDALTIEQDGYTVRCRLPESTDLKALAGEMDASLVQAQLLERCILSARHMSDQCDGADLPQAVVAALSEAMEAADPLAIIQFTLTCPACGHDWHAQLDIAAYLWRELDAWARRTLHDVHVLASAYGWSEATILSLRPERRQLYRDLIGS